MIIAKVFVHSSAPDCRRKLLFECTRTTKITWSGTALSLRLAWLSSTSCNIGRQDKPLFWIPQSCSFYLHRTSQNPRSTDFSFFVPRLHDCFSRFCACVIVKGEANNIYALGQQIIMFFIHNNWIFTLQNLFFFVKLHIFNNRTKFTKANIPFYPILSCLGHCVVPL